MDDTASGAAGMPADHYNRNRDDIEFAFEIAVVDGERGSRLAEIQVESILEVVEWFSRHPSGPGTTT